MIAELKPFGPYGLIKEIGHGGSAHVYSAQAADGSLVAVKMFDLGKRAGDASSLHNFFENELAVIRSLNHPNIVKYLDADVIDGVPYIAMELLSGGSLEEKVRLADFLPIDDVIGILTPLASALDYATSRRVLHRDIKPSNVLFGTDGRPVLSDFGIARFAEPREERITRGGDEPPGTSDFMAPEMMLEAPATPASDIYSLGMTVYYSLSGLLPTEGKTVYTRTRDRVEGKLIPLAVRNPNIPGAVSDVVARALSPEPTARFSSARAFASALTVAGVDPAGQGIPARPPAVKGAVENRRSWLAYWRYVVVPLLIALIGALAAWLGSKK